jgi:hypothetical protein
MALLAPQRVEQFLPGGASLLLRSEEKSSPDWNWQ